MDDQKDSEAYSHAMEFVTTYVNEHLSHRSEESRQEVIRIGVDEYMKAYKQARVEKERELQEELARMQEEHERRMAIINEQTEKAIIKIKYDQFMKERAMLAKNSFNCNRAFFKWY